MIQAKVIADSINLQGDRLTTFIVTFPRIILAEFNTHRMFSRNSASSRAIPFEKMVKSVQENPFIPIAWQKHHTGMQGSEYFSSTEMPNTMEENWFENRWLEARDSAIQQAIIFNKAGVTKQLCNRLLEPFMWHTVIITSGKEGLENFFNLRCPQYHTPVSGEGFYVRSWKELQSWHSNPKNEKLLEDNKDDILFKLQHNKGQSEIHIMALAELMYDAYNESTPKKLQAGEWHIPFENNFDWDKIRKQIPLKNQPINLDIKIATAMCARVSYTVVGEESKEPNYENDIKLHNRLAESGHWSPFEHCAKAMSDEEYSNFVKGQFIVTHSEPDYEDLGEFSNSSKGWCNNFKGFIQYRYLIDKN
jgi:thymidylate synthase ThyX